MVDNRFALDTNLLRNPTPRRFLHGIALETERRVVVLPEVRNELIGDHHQLAIAEFERWERRARRQGVSSSSLKKRILDTVRPATIDWYKNTLLHPTSVFDEALLDDAGMTQVNNIIKGFPPEVFMEDTTVFTDSGDPVIVAQAIQLGIELLGSNNLSTISHEKLNAWLARKGMNRPLIYTPSETVNELADQNIETLYQWVMAHAMNHIHEDESDNKKEFRRALDVLAASGFRGTNKRKRESDPSFKTIVFEVNNYFKKDHNFTKVLRETLIGKRQMREKALSLELELNNQINAAIFNVLEPAGKPEWDRNSHSES